MLEPRAAGNVDSFRPRTEAVGWAEQQRIKRKNEGSSAFEFSADLRIDAVAAME